jgi:hypothetical protein
MKKSLYPLSVVCSKAIAGVLRILNEKEFVTLTLFTLENKIIL